MQIKLMKSLLDVSTGISYYQIQIQKSWIGIENSFPVKGLLINCICFRKLSKMAPTPEETEWVTSSGPISNNFNYNLRRIKVLHRETVFTTLSYSFYAESDFGT